MNKAKILLVILTFFHISNALAFHSARAVGYVQKFAPNAEKLAAEVPTPYLKVVVENVTDFSTGSALNNLNLSFKVLEAVVNSEEFKQKVIGYIGTNGAREYSSNKGLTNEQVYAKLMEGKELLAPNTPGEINLNIDKYYRPWSKVIAYTSPGQSSWINVNWRFYRYYKAFNMSGNLMHEWIHLNGFYHDSARDHDSVPYAIGYIMEDLAEKYMQQGYLE